MSHHSKYAQLTQPVGYLPSVGEYGEQSLDVSIRRCIELDTSAAQNGVIQLNAWEARRLGKALIRAAKKLDR